MKEYTNGEIVVVWKPEKCIHSRNCITSLPQVFNRQRRPWIDSKGACSDEIIRAVERCPSGALTWRRAGSAPSSVCQSDGRIVVAKNGPLLVEGSLSLIDEDGNELASNESFALCRCGASKKKPFCDGSHAAIGFRDEASQSS
ncbi:MAG TPA: (4Fe-4S)-binding protein [Methanotrichaceae archaeon]|nr:(4Fe-4S)-binding protein [bacterium]HQF17743.1 (4Fe-4S)-binding protein [Methanotrichaceae archaeon]